MKRSIRDDAPVTLRSVADHAGVSIATASRVLSGARATKEETRERVESAAKALGYRGNAIAAALRTSSTQTVGMVVPQISNPFFPALVEAIERNLQVHHIDLFLCDSQEDPELERRRIHALIARKVDGLIVAPVSQSDSALVINEAAHLVPLVALDREVDGLQAPSVRADDRAGIDMILQHLVEHRVQVVKLVSAVLTTGTARRRHEAFFEGVIRHGMTQHDALLGEFTINWGREAARKMLESGRPLPRAVVCGNDLIAFGLLQEFLFEGLRVPQDIMVTGYDDSSMAAPIGLTTVRQPIDEIARAAVEALRGPSTKNGTAAIYSPELVVRATTGEHRNPHEEGFQ